MGTKSGTRGQIPLYECEVGREWEGRVKGAQGDWPAERGGEEGERGKVRKGREGKRERSGGKEKNEKIEVAEEGKMKR